MNIELFKYYTVQPLKLLGLEHPFLGINLDTLIFTWVGMLMLFSSLLIARFFAKRSPQSMPAIAFEKSVEFLENLCVESIGFFNFNHFALISAIFAFTFFSCLVGLLPFLDEATKDLNTTLAISLSSFSYVQYNQIKRQGIWGYLVGFTKPFILMLPLEVIGKFATILSMSFRLFGNILGGSIIVMLIMGVLERYKLQYIIFVVATLAIYFLAKKFINLSKYVVLSKFLLSLLFLAYLLATLQLLFGVFESLIQSFVLTMLTVTYLSMAIGAK